VKKKGASNYFINSTKKYYKSIESFQGKNIIRDMSAKGDAIYK